MEGAHALDATERVNNLLMRRLVVSLAIAIPISVVVTIILLVAVGFAGGACHCMTPVSVFFPYFTFISMRTRFETVGSLALILQFPVYGIVIAVLNGARQRIIGAFLILFTHSIAAAGALTMYRWW